MNVDAADNSYAQMNVGQYYGNSQGGSQNGMKDIMQNLSMEDRLSLRDQMQSLPKEERVAMKAQLKEVDARSMTQEDYFQSLLDILSQDDTTQEAIGFSVYA